MNIKDQKTSVALNEYEYIPEETAEFGGAEYIVKGTGTSVVHHVLTFKKNGNEIPDPVVALLTDDDLQMLREHMAQSQIDYTRNWHFANLTGLRRALHHAVFALDYIAEEDPPLDAAGAYGSAKHLLPSDEIARLYVLMETFKRSLSAAGLDAPRTRAKDRARTWLEENPAAADVPTYGSGDHSDINYNPEGLRLYSEKKDVDIPSVFLEGARLAASGSDDEKTSAASANADAGKEEALSSSASGDKGAGEASP